ncbi:hypothetical protein [Marinitenerispora sediminis]|uniref:Tetratricopeptide repeat protein n=1 Tax=Marinitenerispora sediminis TaxID=1931232 RepID=A0A368TAT5_9ACTN|nr:hypothetical protein [Marinitenerispora sediminis]RCV53980.1 hypothetical protein DEF28_09350 [Marinitenerispora sediminis]RCV60468.1 hypothetical protein DEF23_04475 [Marinitenerispora sediminis]RCV61850.1 hypothetical protein DEF24_03210 [Marinitenerispora sediminis]
MSVPTSTTRGAAVHVTVDHGAAVSYGGLRTALAAALDAGADLVDLAARYPAEWAVLRPAPDDGRGADIAEIALAPSERRLHRESEQVFRVLSVAAAGLCEASRLLGRPVVVHRPAAGDLTSLRGFMRAVEYARTVPGAEIRLAEPLTVRRPLGPAADYRPEQARCLTRAGVPAAPGDLEFASGRPAAAGSDAPEAVAFSVAMSADADPADRLAAALAYSRYGFFTANWEGMAAVAETVLPLTAEVPDGAVPGLLREAGRGDTQAEAIEFEPTVLRSRADLRAFLYKVLGIQATFRGAQDSAVDYFLRMREPGGHRAPSPETRAQSHLYTALVHSKRLNRLGDAVAELEQGFAAVRERPDEPESVRRERGWLHNLRALTLFRQKRFRPAFEEEKLALGCIAGLDDPSSVHLRINLLSNLSVLQERAGRFEQALATWNRFRTASGADNDSFLKHHSYRAAGLRLALADLDGALPDLAESLDGARRHADDFHEHEIRVETAALLARHGRAEAAAEHAEAARSAAGRLGDPYRIALAGAAAAAVRGAAPAPEVTASLRASLSRAPAAAALAEAVARGPQAVLAALPAPRTKLNRPFDLVNFQD